MKLTIKENKKTKAKIEIEQEWEDFKLFYEKALSSFAKEIELPGFRKGQAPASLVESSLDPAKLLVEAATLSVDDLWPKAVADLEKQKIEAISQPQIELLKLAKGNEFVFSAEFEIMPEIVLPDYKAFSQKIEKKEIKVENKEIEETVSNIQKSRASLIEKKEPAKKEDFVEINFSSPDVENGKLRKDGFILGKGSYPEELEANLVGMSAGESKEVNFNSKEEPAKSLKVKVEMLAVKEMKLPEANDEFAKTLGKFENMEALRKNIKEGIEEEKKTAETQRRREDFLAEISKETNVDLPQVLIDKESVQMMNNAKEQVSQNLGISFEEYLKKINKKEEDLKKEAEEAAKKRVKNFLIMREIAKREKTEASAEQMEERINAILSYYPDLKAAEKEANFEKISAYVEDEIKQENAFKTLGL
ncbi:MAG: trigger factor [Candidatus Paceibacterota bacterium]|jgi:trigger factor|nr:trigger factor [Candidatus Paceibacterota bacterium]